MKKLFILLTILLSLVGSRVCAHEIEVDGIFYNYNSEKQTVTVTYKNRDYGCYSGNITIPSEISYKGKILEVTSIGECAFRDCEELFSVNLPNSIITIEERAFMNCKKLPKIDLPTSLKTIGSEAFKDCRDFVEMYIPANVSKIENDALPVGRYNALSTVYYEDGDDEIELSDYGSYYALNLYLGRPRKTDSYYDYYRGNDLKVLGIGNNVVWESFEEAKAIEKIYSKIIDPSKLRFYFSNSVYLNAILYVPLGTKEKYMNSEGWNNFFQIEEMDTNQMWGDKHECMERASGDGTKESPYNVLALYQLINDNQGQPTYNEVYVTGYAINVYGGTYCLLADKNNEKNRIQFQGSTTIPHSENDSIVKIGDKVVVYGRFKPNSMSALQFSHMEVVPETASLISINGNEYDTSIDASNVHANAALIQNEGGQITVKSVDDGTQVIVYNIDGILAGSSICQHGSAVINTDLQTGSVAIVKVGEKSIKIVLK